MKTLEERVKDPWNYARIHPDGSLMLKMMPRNAPDEEARAHGRRVSYAWGQLIKAVHTAKKTNVIDDRYVWPLIDSDFDIVLLPLRMVEYDDGTIDVNADFSRSHKAETEYRWVKQVFPRRA